MKEVFFQEMVSSFFICVFHESVGYFKNMQLTIITKDNKPLLYLNFECLVRKLKIENNVWPKCTVNLFLTFNAGEIWLYCVIELLALTALM